MAALEAALTTPTVKRFVYTSSVVATLPKPGQKFLIDKNMWNEEAVQIAWAPSPYGRECEFAVFPTSKTQAEQKMLKILRGGSAGGTGERAKAVHFDQQVMELASTTPPQYFSNVVDETTLHVIAKLDLTLKSERVLAFAEPFNWNNVVDVAKTIPGAKRLQHVEGQQRDLSEIDNGLGKKLLRKWYGEDGFQRLKQSVKEDL